jgi:hypothetical protein
MGRPVSHSGWGGGQRWRASCSLSVWLFAGAAGGLLVSGNSPAGAATIEVNTFDFSLAAGDDGWCTLYEAVASANSDSASGALPGECGAGAGDDTVVFSAATPASYFLNFGPLVVTAGLTIVGPGADELTLDAQGFHRIFVYSPTDILAAPTFDLGGMTLTGGWAVGDHNGFGLGSGGALLTQYGFTLLHDLVVRDNLAQDQGAGVYSSSQLTVERSTFDGNSNLGPILFAGGGGAISHNSGYDLTIRDSTFVGNLALTDNPAGALFDPHGGAVLALCFGTITIERSTFVGNRARGAGGAISIGVHRTYPTAHTAVLRFLTVVGNEADTDGDGIGGNPGVYTGGSGGGIFVTDTPGTTSLESSIVAGNIDSGPDKSPDLDGLDFVSLGHNLVGVRRGNGSAAFPAGQPNGNDDWVGTSGSPLAHGLLALGANGGATPTRLPDLAAGPSLAIDHGSCPGESADQRGYSSPGGGGRAVDEPTVVDADDGCDIGAVELGAAAPELFRDGFESQDTSQWSLSLP